MLARERAVHGDHAAAEALADQAQARGARGRRCGARGGGRGHGGRRGALPPAPRRPRARSPRWTAKIARGGRARRTRSPTSGWRSGCRCCSGSRSRAYFTGGFEPARAAAERGLGVARRSGQGLYAPAFVLLRGWVDAELGRLDAAEADAEEALESALLSGNLQVAYWASIVLSRTALARGRIDAALEHGQAAWERLGIIEYSQAGYTVADARLAAGDPQGALAALEAFGWVQPALWTLDRLKAVEVAVRVLLALGRVEEAEAWAQRAPAEGGGRRSGRVRRDHRPRAGRRAARPGRARRRPPQVALAGAAAGDAGRRAAVGRPLPHAWPGEALAARRPRRGRARASCAAPPPSSRRAAPGATATPRCACCVASATARADDAPRARQP